MTGSQAFFSGLFSIYVFAFITFGDGFFQFQDNKVSLRQAPGHGYENTIYQPEQCPFKPLKSVQMGQVQRFVPLQNPVSSAYALSIEKLLPLYTGIS